MKNVQLPASLLDEFRTVNAVLESGGTTRRIDALILAWVKYEKQLRRLFCFLVFQHPRLTEESQEKVIQAIVNNNRLYPQHFQRGVSLLSGASIESLIGAQYDELRVQMERIREYRNKFMHGQISGKRISSRTIEKDIDVLLRWVGALAIGAQNNFGYDGLGRNTYRAARANRRPNVGQYPFGNVDEFEEWLSRLR